MLRAAKHDTLGANGSQTASFPLTMPQFAYTLTIYLPKTVTVPVSV